MNEEKIRAKQELEVLENKYSLDLIAYKTNLEESTNQIENLKSEVIFIFRVCFWYLHAQLKIIKLFSSINKILRKLRTAKQLHCIPTL